MKARGNVRSLSAIFSIVILSQILTGCGGSGGSFDLSPLVQRSAILHPGDTVDIDGDTVGYCKHAWKAGEDGKLRSAVIFGHPQDNSQGSPWGAGLAYDYVRVDEESIHAIRTDYDCIILRVWVHPDEGEHASDEVHRASWIHVTWTE